MHKGHFHTAKSAFGISYVFLCPLLRDCKELVTLFEQLKFSVHDQQDVLLGKNFT